SGSVSYAPFRRTHCWRRFPAQTDSIFVVQGAVMVNKASSIRVSSNGKGRPQVDGSSMENELLLGLPSNEGDSIFSKLTFVQLRTHDVLHESEQPIKFAYFMNSGLTSILTVMAEGKNIEVGLRERRFCWNTTSCWLQ